MTTQPRQCPVAGLEKDYNPLVTPQMDNPGPVWAKARAEQPVFFSEILNAWVVTRHADILQILRQPEVFGPGVARKMFAQPCPEADRLLEQLPPLDTMKVHSSEPPVHTKLRRYLQPAFLPHKVAELEPTLTRWANDLVDTFAKRGHAEFYEDYAYRYPLEVVSHLIGLPREDVDQVKEWTDQQAVLRYGDPSPAEQVALAQSQLDSFQYTLNLVAARRAAPGEDMLSWIIADSDSSDDPLTDEQLASQATSLLTAGHETSAHFLTMLMHRILTETTQWDRLVADPTDSVALLEEALRMDGPVQSLWRRVKVDTEIAGTKLSAGDRISVVLGSANLDEQVFEHPSRFDIERSDAARHIAFGRGIHTCVGAGIARLEARTTLEVLATRLPTLRLAEDDGYLFKPGATQRMAERLYVIWD